MPTICNAIRQAGVEKRVSRDIGTSGMRFVSGGILTPWLPNWYWTHGTVPRG